MEAWWGVAFAVTPRRERERRDFIVSTRLSAVGDGNERN